MTRRLLKHSGSEAYIRKSLLGKGLDKHIVDELLSKMSALGLIDDKKYSLSKIRSSMSRGASTKYIRHFLLQRGVRETDIQWALQQIVKEEGDDWEERSARVYLRRCRHLPAEKTRHRLRNRGFSQGIIDLLIDNN